MLIGVSVVNGVVSIDKPVVGSNLVYYYAQGNDINHLKIIRATLVGITMNSQGVLYGNFEDSERKTYVIDAESNRLFSNTTDAKTAIMAQLDTWTDEQIQKVIDEGNQQA